jgi:aminoglycoside phosphotransferase (APT) family kinase protein
VSPSKTNAGSALPSAQALCAVLRSGLRESGFQAGKVEILDRRAWEGASSFPSEVLTCRLDGSGELRVHAKYERREPATSHGHRGGVRYEAVVYRHLLDLLPVSTPKFYATHVEQPAGRAWLLIEHLDGAQRLWDESQAVQAASWIGRFQRLSRGALDGGATAVLRRYDAGFYADCARTMLRVADDSPARPPWLKTLCERFEELAPALAERQQAVCHGEYYTKNILVKDDRVFPVDWESAAVGLGEIDLATLTRGWSQDVTRQCECAYSYARWPMGAPRDWTDSLKAAQVYISLRWPSWAKQRVASVEFDVLRRRAEGFGLV